jgi:hypothetical protein
MKPISPSASAAFNAIAVAVGAVLGYLATNGLPDTVDPATAHAVKSWSQWLVGVGAPVLAAINAYLHAVSGDQPGPLVK